MLPFEDWARPLLIAHTLCALAAVFVCTHLVVWLWPWVRGRFVRERGVRRFAVLGLVLYSIAFVGGNMIYPLYKTRVRTEFLEAPGAVAQAAETRDDLRIAARKRHTGKSPPRRHTTQGAELRAGAMVQWFDIKEHLVALGWVLCLGIFLILRRYRPREHGAHPVPVLFGMTVFAAACGWIAAIIGFAVASYRSIGPL